MPLFFLVARDQGPLVIIHIRTHAHVRFLGMGGRKAERTDAPVQQVHRPGRLLPGQFPTERAAEHRGHRIDIRRGFSCSPDTPLP